MSGYRTPISPPVVSPWDSSSCAEPRSRLLQLSASSNPEPNWDSTNPWSILGIPSGSSKADIKKAYKRLAMRYHPDVVVSPDEKQAASEKFSKINVAYQAALEMERSGTASSSSSSAAGSSSWEPPHRRAARSRPSSSYTSSSPSTDWRDYMPDYNNEDAQYDTNGDTFGKIFSDLFREAGGGGVGVVSDFVEFFESNFAYGSSSSSGAGTVDDPELRELLQTGTVGDVGDAMDETELVVQQLQTKRQNSANELMQLQADRSSGGMSYSEQMEVQERIDELEAQQKVVDGYIEKARKRLLTLQTRYKDLIVNGKQDDRKARSSWDEIRNEASGSKRTTSTRTQSEPAASPSKEPTSSSSDEAWKSEGFGSYGRGRGSSRRRRQRQPTTSTSASSTESSTRSRPRYDDPPKRSQTYERASRTTTSATNRRPTDTTGSPSYSNPPHRRAGTSSYAQKLEDQRRLREIKVEEEFDQLKKDLGL